MNRYDDDDEDNVHRSVMMTYWVHDDEAAVLITISAVDSGDGCYVRLCQSRDTLSLIHI